MLQATRTLVKSAPELWAEIADPDALAAHLEVFGELSITDCEQERLVRWTADHGKGEVELEPAGFGTRVRLRAESSLIAQAPVRPVVTAPAPAPRPTLWQRLLRRAPAPAPAPEVPTTVAVPALADDQVLQVLRGTLDVLGTARHRPFSRA